MINESLSNYVTMKEYLSKELHYGMERMKDLVKYTRCRKSYIISKWNESSREQSLKVIGFRVMGLSPSPEDIQKNQNLKATVGYILANLMGLNHFSYEDKQM
jgi:hypothetical protein